MSKRGVEHVHEVQISSLPEDILREIVAHLNALEYWPLAYVSKHWESLFTDRRNVCLIVEVPCRKCGAKSYAHACNYAFPFSPCVMSDDVKTRYSKGERFYRVEQIPVRLFYRTCLGGFCVWLPHVIGPNWGSGHTIGTRLFRLIEGYLEYFYEDRWFAANGIKFIDIVRHS